MAMRQTNVNEVGGQKLVEHNSRRRMKDGQVSSKAVEASERVIR